MLVVWAVLFGGMMAGAMKLEVDTTTDSVLDTESAEWNYYQSSEARFGGDEIVAIALPGDRPFDERVLQTVRRLTRKLQDLPGVRRVDSLSTVPLVRSAPDGTLRLEPALGSPDVWGGDGWAGADAVRSDRIAPGSLVSPDGRVAAINILVRRGFRDYRGMVQKIRHIIGAERAWVSGVPVFRTEASERTQREVLLFVPVTVVVIGLLLSAAFGSIRGTAVALTVGGSGGAAVAGTMGFLGSPMSLVTMILPSVMLALGCAYAVHLISAARPTTDGVPLEDRLVRVALPVALSSLTTAVGFSAIGMVRIDEVRHVGAFGAIGAMVLGAASLTLAPALLVVWANAIGGNRLAIVEEQLRQWLLVVALRRRRLAFMAWATALALVGVGVGRVQVVTDATRWFPPGNEVRDSYESIRSKLSGISPVNVVVESVNGEAVTSPQTLEAIDGLAEYLRSLKQVGKVVSLSDPLRQLHGGFLDDSSMPLPVEPGLAEQYLLLLEPVQAMRDLITPDHTAANIIMRVNDNSSSALLDIEHRVDDWWRLNGPKGFVPKTTGIMYEFARAEDDIAYGQIRGLVFALGAIGIVLLFALRSVPLALVSLVPNVVPTAMVFGAMGWLGMPLDAGTVVVGSLALGIAVDDTIHVVSGFHDHWAAGETAEASLRASLASVLHPVVLTSIVIGAGFGILGFSGFSLTRNLGLLMAGVTLVCLLADLLLLPALLMTLHRRQRLW